MTKAKTDFDGLTARCTREIPGEYLGAGDSYKITQYRHKGRVGMQNLVSGGATVLSWVAFANALRTGAIEIL